MIRGIINAGIDLGKSEMLTSQLYAFERGRRQAATLSIKYVLSGEENYQVNNDVYAVKAGNFLLIEQDSSYTTILSPRQLNEGLCLYIDRHVIEDVAYTLTQKDEGRCLEQPFREAGRTFDLTEGTYRDEESAFGQQLSAIGREALANGGRLQEYSSEQFYLLVEKFVFTQKKIAGQIKGIGAKKPSVQKELFRRVEEGRKFILDNFNRELTVEEIAGNAHLSPYHFMRTFKQVHAVSTYQYILDRRLQKAFDLNNTGKFSITEIALSCGFTDIYTFSKAFKRKYGHSPRNLPAQIVLSGQ